MSPPVVLTAEQLAERWQLTRAQVYRLARTGEIPAIPCLGRYRRFSLAVIEAIERGESLNERNEK
jgi:excisionase family DNA binding protein